ncbi:hypothetical protein Ddc_15712 [Ditylenchus destructor]|nr:hypothetical protein Ddc_15712 [Ditylenchus destructor]
MTHTPVTQGRFWHLEWCRTTGPSLPRDPCLYDPSSHTSVTQVPNPANSPHEVPGQECHIHVLVVKLRPKFYLLSYIYGRCAVRTSDDISRDGFGILNGVAPLALAWLALDPGTHPCKQSNSSHEVPAQLWSRAC